MFTNRTQDKIYVFLPAINQKAVGNTSMIGQAHICFLPSPAHFRHTQGPHLSVLQLKWKA